MVYELRYLSSMSDNKEEFGNATYDPLFNKRRAYPSVSDHSRNKGGLFSYCG
jgi:hypothetical protein